MSDQTHLAQLNIGRIHYLLDDPRMADFVDNLDRVNTLAERSPGFVWRLKDENGNATSVRAYDDPRIIVNLSVWQSVEALERFVFRTIHRGFYGRRREWFETMDEPHFVMWWVRCDHEPSVVEARARLDHLKSFGADETAFDWEYLSTPQLWKTARCG